MILNMLKLPPHQVAGHQATGGKLGPLVDGLGRFFKPLQGDARGSNEVAFYESFFSNSSIPDHIRRFVPAFHGTQHLEASDGSGLQPHMVLEDFVASCHNPTLMDIKMGSRTWPLDESEKYIAKCMKKDRESTSLPLGFRISGLQVYGNKETGFWKPDKKLVQRFSAEDVRLVLRKFVSSNVSADLSAEPDCSFASQVYGGSSGILAQLLELKSWFEDQTIMHFYSCSVLIVYDKELVLKGIRSSVQVKLIDFAHVVDGGGIIDHNFLGGLCSLIKFISEICEVPNASPISGLQETETSDHPPSDNILTDECNER